MNKSLSKKQTIGNIVINIFLFISTIIIVVRNVVYGAGAGQLGSDMYGEGYFKAFTTLSNILLALCALNMLVAVFKGKIPLWISKFYLIGTAAVGLTFIVVLIFLAPLQLFLGKSFFLMYSGSMIFFHFINPLLAMICTILFIPKVRYLKKDILLCEIPTVIYSLVYLFCVEVFKVWEDFYFFTFGGKTWTIPFSMSAMYLLTFVVASSLIKLHNSRC